MFSEPKYVSVLLNFISIMYAILFQVRKCEPLEQFGCSWMDNNCIVVVDGLQECYSKCQSEDCLPLEDTHHIRLRSVVINGELILLVNAHFKMCSLSLEQRLSYS